LLLKKTVKKIRPNLLPPIYKNYNIFAYGMYSILIAYRAMPSQSIT
jgi:hypothetical protein